MSDPADVFEDTSVAALIAARRTSLRMDPELPVQPDMIRELCELATWAPNHHRTEPWRFAVFTGEGRRRLGETIAARQAAEGVEPTKIAKTRTKYLRAPAMLLVGSIPGTDDVITAENRYAVAAAVQNILLAATDAGLASFWSSVATPTDPDVIELCGFEPGTVVIAAVYLGHPTSQCSAPSREDPIITWVE
jgi:nitroreductase